MTRSDQVPLAVTVTRSYASDLILFGAFVVLLLVSAPRLLVYHRITVMEIRVERVDPDGTTHTMALPTGVSRRRLALTTPDAALPRVSEQIREYMRESPMPRRQGSPGSRLRWVVRYGYNSPRLDRETAIAFDE